MASLFTETITDMTSIFTPPADCTRSWTFEDETYNSVPGGLLLQNQDSLRLDETCFPTSFGGYGRAPSSIQVYSPGACPGGYATPGFFQNEGITTAICCPSSFSYGSTYSSVNYFGTTSVLFMGCISKFDGTTTVSGRGNSSMIEVVGTDLTMWAQPITVEYKQEDLSLFGMTSTVSGTASTASGGTISNTATLPGASPTTNSSSPANTSPAPDPSQEHTGSSSLSTGAKAGIGVAVGLLAVGAIAFGLVFILRRRKQRFNKRMPPEDLALRDSKYHPVTQYQDTWERRELDTVDTEVRPEVQPPQYAVKARNEPGQVNELE